MRTAKTCFPRLHCAVAMACSAVCVSALPLLIVLRTAFSSADARADMPWIAWSSALVLSLVGLGTLTGKHLVLETIRCWSRRADRDR